MLILHDQNQSKSFIKTFKRTSPTQELVSLIIWVTSWHKKSYNRKNFCVRYLHYSQKCCCEPFCMFWTIIYSLLKLQSILCYFEDNIWNARESGGTNENFVYRALGKYLSCWGLVRGSSKQVRGLVGIWWSGYQHFVSSLSYWYRHRLATSSKLLQYYYYGQ